MLVFPFKNLIAATLELPYMSLSTGAIAGYVGACMILSVLTGLVASFIVLVRIRRSETFLLMKEVL